MDTAISTAKQYVIFWFKKNKRRPNRKVRRDHRVVLKVMSGEFYISPIGAVLSARKRLPVCWPSSRGTMFNMSLSLPSTLPSPLTFLPV